LVIPDKINLSSNNTYLLSVYSEDPLILSNLFFSYKELNKIECKILSLSLNSIITLVQFITFKSETLGSYIRLAASDWKLTKQLNKENLSKKEIKELLDLFDKIKNIEFPSIIEQLETKFPARVNLDTTILRILGLTNEEINEWLPKIYNIIVEELKMMKEIK